MRDDPLVREKLAKQKMQPVSKEAGERMAKELGAVKYVECSALTQYKLKDVFDEVHFTLWWILVSLTLGRLSLRLWNHLRSQGRRAESVFCSNENRIALFLHFHGA